MHEHKEVKDAGADQSASLHHKLLMHNAWSLQISACHTYHRQSTFAEQLAYVDLQQARDAESCCNDFRYMLLEGRRVFCFTL